MTCVLKRSNGANENLSFAKEVKVVSAFQNVAVTDLSDREE